MIENQNISTIKQTLIDELIVQAKSLEISLATMKEKGKVSFTVLNDAFSKAQKIITRLHDLEIAQVNAMQEETEKLLNFWSEKIGNQKPEQRETDNIAPNSDESGKIEPKYLIYDKDASEVAPILERGNMEDQPVFLSLREAEIKENIPSEEAPRQTVLNDVLAKSVTSASSSCNLKQHISLNDRYLFQRELFNNDRHKMNDMMRELNAFNSYREAETYLRDHTEWDFESDIVNQFLTALQRGFQ